MGPEHTILQNGYTLKKKKYNNIEERVNGTLEVLPSSDSLTICRLFVFHTT